jgi:hypothetical protein
MPQSDTYTIAPASSHEGEYSLIAVTLFARGPLDRLFTRA